MMGDKPKLKDEMLSLSDDDVWKRRLEVENKSLILSWRRKVYLDCEDVRCYIFRQGVPGLRPGHQMGKHGYTDG